MEYITKETILKMLNKIENAVEDGEGYQFNEWVGYVEELPNEDIKDYNYCCCAISFSLLNKMYC